MLGRVRGLLRPERPKPHPLRVPRERGLEREDQARFEVELEQEQTVDTGTQVAIGTFDVHQLEPAPQVEPDGQEADRPQDQDGEDPQGDEQLSRGGGLSSTGAPSRRVPDRRGVGALLVHPGSVFGQIDTEPLGIVRFADLGAADHLVRSISFCTWPASEAPGRSTGARRRVGGRVESFDFGIRGSFPSAAKPLRTLESTV